MAVLAERLMIIYVPEQLLVTLVWNDVVHDRCRSTADITKRVPFQEPAAILSPLCIVSTLAAVQTFFIIAVKLALMFITITISIAGKSMTAILSALPFEACRHMFSLPCIKIKKQKEKHQFSPDALCVFFRFFTC
nr:MAG TPA: hypothetical protein [Caudoviricetes sp.]